MDGAAAGPATNRSSARPDGPHDPRAGDVESNPPTDSPPSVPTDDERIFCPICHYNLTGILSGRCPECGSLFDREQLLKAQRADHVTLMPWDDPRVESRWRAFWDTTYIACARPERFASAFSVQPQKTNSQGYYFLCLFMMTASIAAVGSLTAVLARNAHDIVPVVMMSGVPVAATIVGNIIWPILYTILVVHPDGQRHYRPWRAIVHYAGAHLLLYAPLCTALCLATPIVMYTLHESIYLPFALQIGAVGVFVLWCMTMRAVIRSRAPASTAIQDLARWGNYIGGTLVYIGTWIAVTALRI